MTESQTFELQKIGLMQIDRAISERLIDFSDISDFLPGWIHLNRKDNMGISRMCHAMENDLEISSADAGKKGPAFLQNIIDPVVTVRVIPAILGLQRKGDSYRIIGFHQRIRNNEGAPYQTYYTAVKLSPETGCFFSQSILMKELDKVVHITPRQLMNESMRIADFQQFQALSGREKEILCQIAIGESNESIGIRLNISPFTVKTHRQNIYRKLEFRSIHDVIRFAMRIGIIA